MLRRGTVGRFALRKTPADRLRVLRALVRDAWDNVRLYRELYAGAGIRSSDIASLDAFTGLPIVRRPELLGYGHEGHLRRGADPARLMQRCTSGSSGEPLTVFSSRLETFFRKATLLESFRRAAPIRLPVTIADVGTYTVGRDIAQALRLVRVARISRFLPIAEQVAQLCRTSPDLIEGRPTSMEDVVHEAGVQGVALPRPRAVICFGEVLYPATRRRLEAAFGCYVADYYNCEEVGNVAWQCPLHVDRLHVNGATSFLEVVDDEGRPVAGDGSGHVLLTNLYNWTMPFIRYAVGDRARNLGEGPCECGFSGLSIGALEGRDEDFFTLPDGRRISPRTVHSMVAGGLPAHEIGNELFRAIRAFQMVQEAPDLVVVNVVPGPRYSADLWTSAQESARRLHPALRVEVRCVEALERTGGGKVRQVMSRVGAGGRSAGRGPDSTLEGRQDT